MPTLFTCSVVVAFLELPEIDLAFGAFGTADTSQEGRIIVRSFLARGRGYAFVKSFVEVLMMKAGSVVIAFLIF